MARALASRRPAPARRCGLAGSAGSAPVPAARRGGRDPSASAARWRRRPCGPGVGFSTGSGAGAAARGDRAPGRVDLGSASGTRGRDAGPDVVACRGGRPWPGAAAAGAAAGWAGRASTAGSSVVGGSGRRSRRRPAATTQVPARARKARGARAAGRDERAGDGVGGWVLTCLSSARRQTCRTGVRIARGVPRPASPSGASFGRPAYARQGSTVSSDCPYRVTARPGSAPRRATLFAVSTPAVVVVGAGLVGSAVAWELASRGAAVSVFDAREPGYGATQASAGMLAPFTEVRASGPFESLCIEGLDVYDDFVARLRRETDAAFEFTRCGSLELALDDAGLAHLRHEHARVTAWPAARRRVAGTGRGRRPPTGVVAGRARRPAPGRAGPRGAGGLHGGDGRGGAPRGRRRHRRRAGVEAGPQRRRLRGPRRRRRASVPTSS